MLLSPPLCDYCRVCGMFLPVVPPRGPDPICYGCKERRDKIVEANVKLVPAMVGRMRRPGSELAARLSVDDAIGAGNVGLVKAAERFDPRLGFKFSTYACQAIKRAILDEFFHRSSLIRVPAPYLVESSTVNASLRDAAMRARNGVKQFVLSSDHEQPYEADGSPVNEDDQGLGDDIEKLLRLLAKLPKRIQAVLRRRYNGEGLASVADFMGISRQRVQQLQAEGLRRLRESWGKA